MTHDDEYRFVYESLGFPLPDDTGTVTYTLFPPTTLLSPLSSFTPHLTLLSRHVDIETIERYARIGLLPPCEWEVSGGILLQSTRRAEDPEVRRIVKPLSTPLND